MAVPYSKKARLSKNILQMKFMKKSKEKDEKEKEKEESYALFKHEITDAMKTETCRFIFEPSFAPCQDLVYGRFAFKNFNPEVEKLMKSKWAARNGEEEPDESEGLSEKEMAKRYTALIGNISNKFKTNREKSHLKAEDKEEELTTAPRVKQDNQPKLLKKRKAGFLKPEAD